MLSITGIYTSDMDLQSTFRKILKRANVNSPYNKYTKDILVDLFIKNSWHQLIYSQYITEDNGSLNDDGITFSIVDNEENWNRILDNLNKNNLGLDGLAGIALGLLMERMKEDLRTGKSKIKRQKH